MRWNEGLEGQALVVASTPDSPLRVVAGPGTGKTFSLMRRVTRLLEEGADPRRVLVCTFTRTAAADLAREVAGLGVTGAEDIWAGTLHAYCFQLLRRTEVLETTGRVPRPLLDFENRFMLQDLMHQGFGGIRECQNRLLAFNAGWARLQSDEPGWPDAPEDRRFHNGLLSWLRFHLCMLVGELVSEAVHYLRDNPASRDRRAFDHVLIDEYQDLNRAEQVILDLLAGQGSLTIIGDEDQSIYSFKFAHPEGIAEFSDTHPGTHDEDLLECRRCPQRVVDMANSLIANNINRSARTLTCREGNPEGEIHVVQWHSMEEEAQGLAQFIHNRVRRGDVAPGGVLVLAPRRQIGYAIRDTLNGLGTNAHSFFNEEAFDGRPQDGNDCASQQAFTLLSLLADLDDIVSLRCWCGFGSSSLRAPAWKRLRDHCNETVEDPRQVLEQLAVGTIHIPYTGQLVTRYQELQQRLADLRDLAGQALIDALFPEDSEWAAPFRLVSPTNDDGEDCGPTGLFEGVRTRIIQPELPTDVEYVRIMSLHKSKGLTADMVVVAGCIAGMIPGAISNDPSPADQQRTLEEQRRLFFVAITRSRRVLVLSNFMRLRRDLAYRMRVPVRRGNMTHATTYASRFMRELGRSCPIAVPGDDFIATTTRSSARGSQ